MTRAIALGAALGVLVGVGVLYLMLMYGPDTMVDW